MNTLTFAAIDIGSNGVRLLFSNVYETEHGPSFKKILLVRLPIRLGADTFDKGGISEDNIFRLIHAMHAYKHLLKVYQPVAYRACATSALREADNGKEVAARIWKETGLEIALIDGTKEAAILFSAYPDSFPTAEENGKNKDYLYMDIGGGSTELTLFSEGKGVKSGSFKTGTIRKLKNKEDQQEKRRMELWVKEIAARYDLESVIGSGGNINKLAKLAGKKELILLSWIIEMKDKIASYSYEERIGKFDMNPDRADVILPAMEIIISVMQCAGINTLHAPKFGLADGIIRQLYYEYKERE